MINPVFVPPGVLFAGALLEIVLAGILSRAAKGWLAFLITTTALLAVLAMMPAVIYGDVLTATWFNWDTGIPLACHVDGLSILFMLLGTGMGSAILLYSVGYMEEETEGITRFYVLMLVFIGGFVMLVCAANLLLRLLRVGGHRLVLLFFGRLLVQATCRRRRRRARCWSSPTSPATDCSPRSC